MVGKCLVWYLEHRKWCYWHHDQHPLHNHHHAQHPRFQAAVTLRTRLILSSPFWDLRLICSRSFCPGELNWLNACLTSPSENGWLTFTHPRKDTLFCSESQLWLPPRRPVTIVRHWPVWCPPAKKEVSALSLLVLVVTLVRRLLLQLLQCWWRDAGEGDWLGEGGEECAARRLGSEPDANYDGLGVLVLHCHVI